jgi:hypothetical protein
MALVSKLAGALRKGSFELNMAGYFHRRRYSVLEEHTRNINHNRTLYSKFHWKATRYKKAYTDVYRGLK